MNIVIASSRGAGLQAHLPKGSYVTTMPGGRLTTLMNKAKDDIPPPHGLTKRYHIYFLCGVPDITSLVKDRNENYRECIYNNEPSHTTDNYVMDLKECQREILKCGALPIFATITKINIRNYNMHSLDNNKTSCLKFSDKYQIMQSKLDQAINLINVEIHKLNKKIGVSSPFSSISLRKKR